jgi:hypothetical protein
MGNNYLIFFKQPTFNLYTIGVGLVVLAVLFHVPLSRMFGEPFSIIDEILIGYAIFTTVRLSLIDKAVGRLIVSLLVLILIWVFGSISAFHERGTLRVILQVIIHLKFFFLVILLYAYRNRVDQSLLLRYILHVTLAGMVLNLVLGETLNNFMEISPQTRLAGLRPIGLQGNTGELGIALAFLYIVRINSVSILHSTHILLTTAFFVPCLLYSSTRTALAAFPISLSTAYIRGDTRAMAPISILIVTLLVLPFTDFFQENLSITLMNIGSMQNAGDGYIRGMIVFYSFELASKYFPFGSGAATFGSLMAADSHVYYELGIKNDWRFKENSGVYDCNFATILGEFGYIGLLAFSLTLFIFFRFFYKKSCKKGQLVSATLMAMFLTFTNPMFMSSTESLLLALVWVSSIKQTQYCT